MGKVSKFLKNGPLTSMAAGGTAKVIKPMVKDTEANIGNLWLGKKESAWGAVAAWSAAGGYMYASGLRSHYTGPKQGEVSYGGTAPIHDADGVGSRAQAPTLGAGGNMVFGLHQARKG